MRTCHAKLRFFDWDGQVHLAKGKTGGQQGDPFEMLTEMETLESQEEDAPKRVLWYTPMGWLGQIRPHRRDEAWSASFWQTCFATCVGAKIPALAELLLSACGYKSLPSTLLAIMLALVLPIPEPKKLTTGRLI
jgi:hypothetical protein